MASGTDPANFVKGLRVESMGVHTSSLQTELVLEIWVRYFNATGEEIRIAYVDGAVMFMDGTTSVGLRPVAMERRFKETVSHHVGSIVTVQQPVPREIADKILGINNSTNVVFSSEALDIIVGSTADPHKTARLALWNRWEVYGDPARPTVSQIITGVANIHLDAVTAGNPTMQMEKAGTAQGHDFDLWPTPAAARSDLIGAGIPEGAAERALLAAITSGLIQVSAQKVVLNPLPPGGIAASTSPLFVPVNYWPSLMREQSDFLAGYVAFEQKWEGRRETVPFVVTYFGLKLNPEDVRKHFPLGPVTPMPDTKIERPEVREDVDLSDSGIDEAEGPVLQKLTAEELKEWIVPKMAIDRFVACQVRRSDAIDAVLGRLKAGVLRAGAEKHAAVPPRQPRGGVVEIEAERWRSLTFESPFWMTGDATLGLPGPRGSEGWIAMYSYFGVRFEPAELGRMLASAGERQVAAMSPTVVDRRSSSSPKAPPVSIAALEKWADAYRLAYQGADDVLETAYRSAEGAFPGRFVSRDRIRGLVGGGRKRGPKGPRHP